MVQRKHIILGVVGIVSLLMIGSWAGARPNPHRGNAAHVVGNPKDEEEVKCTLDFVRYESSAWELEWLDGVATWGAYEVTDEVYCKKVNSEKDKVTDVLAGVAQMTETRTTTLPDTPRNREIFSRFIYEETCSTGNGAPTVRTVEKLIEPLAQALRKFGSICISNDILAREYIVFDSDKDRPPREQHFYLDLGASTYLTGMGGLSQRWFFDEYAARELTIDRALMWEVNPVKPEELFAAVPDEYMHTYQYFNIPCESEAGHGKNPLTMIEKMATPNDFVTLKIDIDTPEIENKLTEQLLAGVEKYSKVIDEFFYEHHVHFPPMMKRGWWPVAGLLEDTYKMHLTLRQHGIRAHGWP